MSFSRGETIVCTAEVRDSLGALVDATTSMKITITDRSGNVEVNAAAMTKSNTGEYYYNWTTTASTPVGEHTASAVCDDSGVTSTGQLTIVVV